MIHHLTTFYSHQSHAEQPVKKGVYLNICLSNDWLVTLTNIHNGI